MPASGLGPHNLIISPQFLSSRDFNKEPKPAKDFKLYDAIPAEAPVAQAPISDEVDKFLPLLNDYLKSWSSFSHDLMLELKPEQSMTSIPATML
jgi:hypothetical protein